VTDRDDKHDRDDKESIPLMLARPSTRPSLHPSPPVPPRSAPETTDRPGSVRGATRSVAHTRLGAAGMLFVAIFADVLANDLPLACSVQGRVFLLPAVTQPKELTYTGSDAIRREASWSVFPLVPHGPSRVDSQPLIAPGTNRSHPFGTDREGHDVFARVVHGTRSYIVFALLAVAASLALGALFGGLAGLFGGGIDALVARAIETISAFPPLVLVLGVQAAVPRPTLGTLFLAIALTRWPEAARLVRAEVMLATTHDYVLAARALGASPLRILRRHVAPNVRGPLIVAAAVGIAAVVLTEASLDFLHIGVPAGSASWGETMSQFRDAPGAWWLLAFPGVLLVATVIGHNLVGEAFRDALDVRNR
jgi:ABC-type dipeptide/oligopeptide/nickel transport system permease subunit